MRKLLIANRGEIACRIIATARRMGIATVAVYSDVDASARHVGMANEAVRIGPAPVAESYLHAASILDAARRTGADGIHPGYGFLSENPDFADAVVDAGLIFVGPPAGAIRAMGLKDAAKRLMEQAGVPVVPGYHGADQNAGLLAQEAAKIGYPVLIKARAGGGGMGMRRVDDPAEFAAALQAAQREGQASFGDPAVLIEKYILSPRHIEVQVFADAHGSVVHLFERDCSLQRRHQKVIEEAPAPGMTTEMRAAMGAAAVEAARSVGYVGAGTVEFIVDASDGLRPDRFWFMEMNTRLQVEHPVTEAITGLDLVEWQVRVAMGENLPLSQADLSMTGHAIEARLYAEDVPRGFLPATGRLDVLTFPSGAQFRLGPVRIDSGVVEGDQISPWYDPMIAKVIVHAATREAALASLTSALIACDVSGVTTNLDFLIALSLDPGFANGAVDTGLIGRQIADLSAPPDLSDALLALVAVAMGVGLGPAVGTDPWDRLVAWRQWGAAQIPVQLSIGGTSVTVNLRVRDDDRFEVETTDRVIKATVRSGQGGHATVEIGGLVTAYTVKARSGQILICGPQGRSLIDLAKLPGATLSAPSQSHQITAPMPGLVKVVLTSPGNLVQKGDPLMIVEAMKMEHTLIAPRDGTVRHVGAVAGQAVTDGIILVELEPQDD